MKYEVHYRGHGGVHRRGNAEAVTAETPEGAVRAFNHRRQSHVSPGEHYDVSAAGLTQRVIARDRYVEEGVLYIDADPEENA